MTAATPHPIQKMEGIKSAPYRTAKPGGIHDGVLDIHRRGVAAGPRMPPPTELTLVL